MNFRHKSTKRRREAGVAMLIAIFALLLISVIAIALIVSSGTETALAKNYRTSTSAYYAGLAGLEEARGRLLWRNPTYVNNVIPGFMSPSGTPAMTLSQVLYILNPAGAEVVDPTDLSSSNPYADNEYLSEFNIPITAATVQTITSVSGSGGIPGPQFKWVRITPATEQSLAPPLGLDVDNDGASDKVSPLYYDPMNISKVTGTPRPGLIVPVPGNPLPTTAVQALEITALAVIPPNTQKLLQYVVVPGTLNLSFPSALTLDGNNVVYKAPTTNPTLFFINGNDNTVNRTCATPLVFPSPYAIGYTNAADSLNIANATSPNQTNYTGTPPPPIPAPPPAPDPSVGPVVVPPAVPLGAPSGVPLPPGAQTPSSLDSLAQSITQSADVILTPPVVGTPVTGGQMPAAMNASNPMNIVVQGDLDLTSWHNQGYGLLLVTGTLTYDPDASWYGVVLAIGKGLVVGSHAGTGRIQGAMFVAQTRDPATGNLLADPNLGPASVDFSALNPSANMGIYYDSCWISTALRPPTYQVLSFREIPTN
jgi:hypothetical protein